MATIRQVAADAGVSIGTVSKVLNGIDDKVDPATKERIWSSIRTLRYKPPAFETNQKAAITHNIGIIIPDLTERPLKSDTYVHLLFDGILEVAAKRGYSVTVFAERMWDNVGNAMRRKYDGRCDGLIAMAPQPSQDLVPSLLQRGAPIVQIGSTAWLEGVSSIDIDNLEVGRMVGRHFLGLGHVRATYLDRPRQQVSGIERLEGLRQTMGACVELAMVRNREETDAFVSAWCALGSARPTAFLTWNDAMAADLVQSFLAAGARVPEDVSVIGVDDSVDAGRAGVPLTTVRNPLDVIGRRAAAMAIDRVEDHSLEPEVILIPTELVVRASTGPA